MRKIAIASRKGGTGKTTTAVHLAAGLAGSGNTVLLTDLDTQGHCGVHLGEDPQHGLGDLIQGNISADGAITRARVNLDLLAGGSNLAGIERLIITRPARQEYVLSEAMKPFEGQYDFVILDCPPGFSALSINAVIYAREILVPVSMEILALTGLLDIEEELSQLREYGIDLQATVAYILPTFADTRNVKTELISNQLREKYGDKVLTPIRSSVRFSEAPGWGQTIFEYDGTGRGSTDYLRICEKVAS